MPYRLTLTQEAHEIENSDDHEPCDNDNYPFGHDPEIIPGELPPVPLAPIEMRVREREYRLSMGMSIEKLKSLGL